MLAWLVFLSMIAGVWIFAYLRYLLRVKISAQFMVDRHDEMRRIRTRRGRRPL